MNELYLYIFMGIGIIIIALCHYECAMIVRTAPGVAWAQSGLLVRVNRTNSHDRLLDSELIFNICNARSCALRIRSNLRSSLL